jgi:superfamily II DNA or RNA helicase
VQMQHLDVDIDKVLKVKNAAEVTLQEPPGYKSKLKRFQKKGVAFLYLAKRGGIFDACGTGKTHVVMALMCLLKSRGELGRCLYVVPAADLLAKSEELGRFTDLNFTAASGTFSKRLAAYNGNFDVIIVSYEVTRGRDFEYLEALKFDTIILDESHVFRNSNTQTAEAVLALTAGASRVVTLSATPIQMSLVDMWSQSKAWHNGIFGTLHSFKRRYVIEEEQEGWRGIRKFHKKNIIGYKNLALPLSARVLTPVGWTIMGELKIGDVVSTPDGGTAEVLDVFDQGPQDIWRIPLSDGSIVESTLDHLWTVKSTLYPQRGWQTLSLEEILKRVAYEGQGYQIPKSGAWEPRTPVQLPVDPYLLGLLLGDGSIKQGTPLLCVAHGEEELLKYAILPKGVVWSKAQRNGESKSSFYSCISNTVENINCLACGIKMIYDAPKSKRSATANSHIGRGLCRTCYSKLYNINAHTDFSITSENPLTLILRELGVWGSCSKDKHIPVEFFNSSSCDRRALLQGLLDTDGWVSNDGSRVHFTTVSSQLATDVVELVRSLGGVAYQHKYTHAENEKILGCGFYYKVVIRLEGELFRLQRKARRLAGRNSLPKKTGRYLRTATFDRVALSRCIKISSSEGLFVTNDYVPTHNCEFQRIIEPFFLRRSIADVEDEMPRLLVHKEWGYLRPAQRTVYDELRKGAVTLLSNGQRKEARKSIHSMQMVVNSTACLGTEQDVSWKLDWLMGQLHKDASGLSGSMSSDKVVLFAQHKSTIRVVTQRLQGAGIGYVTMTGDISKDERERFRKRFWDDPACQVLIGTTAIECSANLHCARFLVAIDSLSNPQRVEQLVGRIRRTGSEHKTVVFVMLLTNDTFEERLHNRLEKRQATVDKVFVESSDIFDSLSDFELQQLFKD